VNGANYRPPYEIEFMLPRLASYTLLFALMTSVASAQAPQRQNQHVHLVGTHQTSCVPGATVDCQAFFKKWAQDACNILHYKGGIPTKIEFNPLDGFAQPLSKRAHKVREQVTRLAN
jgi:hypothetical protein